jgi:hypothetical protein
MKFVSEDAIDKVVDGLEKLDDDQYEQRMEAFAEAQPVLVAYLFNEENFHLLTEDERGFLHYLSLIAWSAIEKVNGPLPEVSEEMIGEAEERNYAMLENSTGKTFRDKLTPFFENHPQEDLLAFAEDAVTEDENEPDALITKEGKEPVFIALKTMIDVLTVDSGR